MPKATTTHPSHYELRMYGGQDRQHSLQTGHWVNHPLGQFCFNLTHSKAHSLCTEKGGSQHAVEDVTACYRRRPAVEGPTPLLPRGGPVCGLEEVYPPPSQPSPATPPPAPGLMASRCCALSRGLQPHPKPQSWPLPEGALPG